MSKPRRIKRPISGVVLLDKPKGFSSNQALQKVRWLYQAEKAGHTGTLDPFATGLLPLCLGEATKFSQRLLEADKGYRATLRLGVTTTTGDTEGEVVATAALPPLDAATVEAVLARFLGPQLQVPPMYSALKRDGKPLYEYARDGIELEREPRPIEIHALRLIALQGDTLVLDVDCGKGTYVRVLAEDIGRALGCGAHLSELRRTRTAGFTLDGAVTVDALEALDPDARDRLLRPADCLVAELPAWNLDADAAYYFGNGQPVWQARMTLSGWVRVYDAAGRFLGLAEVDDEGRLAPRRLVNHC